MMTSTEPLHYQYWPKGVPHMVDLPRTTLDYNLEVSAARYPEKTAISYYGSPISYARLKSEVDALAGYLQQKCGVKKGDRVLLYMQNSPQFIIAYYAILRADAVLVPANPMNLTEEMRHYVEDSGASVAICAIDLFSRIQPLMGPGGLEQVIVADYGEYVTESTDIPIPDFIRSAAPEPVGNGVRTWKEALAADCKPGSASGGARRSGGHLLYFRNNRKAEGLHAYPQFAHGHHRPAQCLAKHLLRRNLSRGCAFFPCHRHADSDEHADLSRSRDRGHDPLGS